MKVGIYVSGLGQSFVQESVDKYATRLVNEMNYSTNQSTYGLKTEKIKYGSDKLSTVVRIFESTPTGQVIKYSLYEFNYRSILTEKFNDYPIVVRNLWLLLLVIRKTPLLLTRLFLPKHYGRPLQTLYLFMIFLIIALAVILMLPSTFVVVKDFFKTSDTEWISTLSKVIVSATATVLLILPNANILISNLAAEFVCANDYMAHGMQRQIIQGNLELLVEYISQHEPDCKIHFHAYSFGSIIAMDYLFPFGNKPSLNTVNFSEALITIGTPYEFINAYYPDFYKDRYTTLEDKIKWINIYSVSDALATNFRKDRKAGPAEFGIEKTSIKPVNQSYDVTPVDNNLFNFIVLYSLKAHGMYWDTKTDGQSCLRLIYDEMTVNQLI